MPRQHLIVIGAGPKGVAIAAKATILSELLELPKDGRGVDVTVVDNNGTAANWTGTHGYTDGNQTLGTPPFKDIGFPYLSECWGDESRVVNMRMLSLSWNAFLIDAGRGAVSDDFSSWIDRGTPAPKHRQWASYLNWALDKCSTSERHPVSVKRKEVRRISIEDGKWALTLRDATGDVEPLVGDGLVITGPGTGLRIYGQSDSLHGRVTDGQILWRILDGWSREAKGQGANFGIIGPGETAASAAAGILKYVGDDCYIDIISKVGVIYSRGESYDENRLYSDPRAWKDLDEPGKTANRRSFIRRTDRGVFSLHAKKVIDSAPNIRTLKGEATQITEGTETVRVEIEGKGPFLYKYVVVAIGFDPMWWYDPSAPVKLLSDKARQKLKENVDYERIIKTLRDAGEVIQQDAIELDIDARVLETCIGHNLEIQEFRPRLHLPMLAGLAEGPGFPNLSCLGLLADRILEPYFRTAGVIP